MKLFLLIIVLCSSIGAAAKDKVLFIVSSVDSFNNQANGTYLMELAIPFHEFSLNNYAIDIVSPNGGEIPIYHKGDTSDLLKSIVQSDHFKNKVLNALTPDKVNCEEYSAIVIPGGYGQFLDTHNNLAIQNIIAEIYEAGGVIGSLGHGTATLLNVQLSTGEFLVKNKSLTCFPSVIEKNNMVESSYGEALPYDMEVELIKKGANLLPFVRKNCVNCEIVDTSNRLITASFASSGSFIARSIIDVNSLKNNSRNE